MEKQSEHEKLTREIQSFWTRHVNAEEIMGREVSEHSRGEDQYFHDLESQRYRSHRHLLPWITSMEKGKTVFEIGCGVGLDTFTMGKHGLRVTAADLTPVAADTISKRFANNNLTGSFTVADACRLPIRDDSFDYVYSFGVLHHTADTDRSIQEVHRILKPGGEARIMLYNRHSLNELVHRLTRVPFEDKSEMCPVVRRFTHPEVHQLFRAFSSCRIKRDFVYGEGYGRVFKLTPLWLYRLMSRYWGWHLMISATK
ncbi:class I SAM-dependent methyltransferase [Thermodesulfobacteriota bacterium]